MSALNVISIQRGCIYDGLGVRTTVFLKGCPFSCSWCCNPEALSGKEYYIDNQKCLKELGVYSLLCESCERKGGARSIIECPFSVCAPIAKRYDSEDLLKELLKDSSLFEQSGGGVTLSGGEPLLQWKPLVPLLSELKAANIHVSIETTLYMRDKQVVEQLIPYIDEWIVDLKLQKEHTKEDYFYVLHGNLGLLRESMSRIAYRLVYVETLQAEKVISQLQDLGINAFELLKCHSLAKSKYDKLGIPFMDYTPSDTAYNVFYRKMLEAGLQIVKHEI